MELAPLTHADRAAFAEMVRAYLAEIAPGLPVATADRIAAAADDPTREALMISEGGTLMGFALLRLLPDGTRELSEFYIRPDARRAGRGTRAARSILLRRPGPWRLGLARAATQAPVFWNSVLAPLTRADSGPPLTPHQTGSLHFTIEEQSP